MTNSLKTKSGKQTHPQYPQKSKLSRNNEYLLAPPVILFHCQYCFPANT